MEATTKKKNSVKETMAVFLLFNEDTKVMQINGSLPLLMTTKDTTFDDINKQLTEMVGTPCGVGDIVVDDFWGQTAFKVFLAFAAVPPAESDSVTYHTIPEVTIDHEYVDKPEDVGANLAIMFGNTFMNPFNPRQGFCYENTKTGEVFYVIHIISDQRKNRNYMLLESTFVDEPIILPSDAFYGMQMKWVSHLRHAQVAESEPANEVDAAMRFFINAHSLTNHRYDGKPYSFHLESVAVDEFDRYKHLVPEADRDQVQKELWGHDGVEDARLTPNDIKEGVDMATARGCFNMTESVGMNRKERHDDAYYDRLASDPYGEFKKLCDRLANVRNSVNTGHTMGEAYKKELEKFERKLRVNGDKYKEMWDDLKELIGDA